MHATINKPAIAFVVAGLGAGGAERVIALLASAWVNDGRQVTVIAFDRPDDPVYHAFDDRIRLVRLGIAGGGAAAVARRVARLRAELRRGDFGVVISFLTKVNVVSLLATVGMPVPVIVCERNNPLRQAAHPAWRWLLHKLYPRAARIVIQTEASRSCLPPAVAKRARVIPNPLAAPPVGAMTGHLRVLTAVGRLDEQKGFDLLLSAFAMIAPRHADWHLAIWGEGPRRAELTTMIRSLGLDSRVSLPGLSKLPGAWLATAGAFVLSSRYEGFPNALGEAMAAGLPVIAFDCPFGPGEMIQNGINGLLIADADVEALAAGLDRFLGDGALRARLSGAARSAVIAYDPRNVFAAWRNLERETLWGSANPPTRST